jgi:hypothetical protein
VSRVKPAGSVELLKVEIAELLRVSEGLVVVVNPDEPRETQDNPGKERIDYIFVRNGIEVLNNSTIIKKEGAVFISDHWPVKISDGCRGLVGCYRGIAFRSISFWDWSPIFVSVAQGPAGLGA